MPVACLEFFPFLTAQARSSQTEPCIGGYLT
jgi:hypothetical protein